MSVNGTGEGFVGNCEFGIRCRCEARLIYFGIGARGSSKIFLYRIPTRTRTPHFGEISASLHGFPEQHETRLDLQENPILKLLSDETSKRTVSLYAISSLSMGPSTGRLRDHISHGKADREALSGIRNG